jgi:hypothetical protein
MICAPCKAQRHDQCPTVGRNPTLCDCQHRPVRSAEAGAAYTQHIGEQILATLATKESTRP